jgi:hypothetical protein
MERGGGAAEAAAGTAERPGRVDQRLEWGLSSGEAARGRRCFMRTGI